MFDDDFLHPYPEEMKSIQVIFRNRGFHVGQE
jgi:hypothetical protein